MIIRRVLADVQIRPTGASDGPPYGLVFISHAAVDNALAQRLGAEIQTRLPDTDTFIASRPRDIPAGEWFVTIKERLWAADVYVSIVTQSSRDRHWVIWEYGAAWMSGKPVILTRAGISISDIPEPFTIFQIRDLQNPEAAAEMLRELGDAGEDLDGFCADITAILDRSSPPRQPPAPIEVRWRGGNTDGWNEVSRNLEVCLRGNGPVVINGIDAEMWHRDAPGTHYSAMTNMRWRPIMLGRGQESFSEGLRFNTSRIPEDLRGQQGTAQHMVLLKATVNYVDSDGLPGTIDSPVHTVT